MIVALPILTIASCSASRDALATGAGTLVDVTTLARAVLCAIAALCDAELPQPAAPEPTATSTAMVLRRSRRTLRKLVAGQGTCECVSDGRA